VPALIAPAALSIITATFKEGAERTKAMGVWAAIAVGGGAVGLVLGGILVEALSWPWIFFVNVPSGSPSSRCDEVRPRVARRARAQELRHTRRGDRHRGLITLVYGIVKTQEKGWASLHTFGFFTLAAVLLVAFLVIESRSAEPLVRLSIFRVPTIRAANIVMFLVASGLFAMFFFNTLYSSACSATRARGGPRVPPLHGGDHHRRRALAAARPGHRRREVPLIGW
jgi:MFS family permease